MFVIVHSKNFCFGKKNQKIWKGKKCYLIAFINSGHSTIVKPLSYFVLMIVKNGCSLKNLVICCMSLLLGFGGTPIL